MLTSDPWRDVSGRLPHHSLSERIEALLLSKALSMSATSMYPRSTRCTGTMQHRCEVPTSAYAILSKRNFVFIYITLLICFCWLSSCCTADQSEPSCWRDYAHSNSWLFQKGVSPTSTLLFINTTCPHISYLFSDTYLPTSRTSLDQQAQCLERLILI